ncbi:hypothetical protein ES703_118573 [subsurface metagenome]
MSNLTQIKKTSQEPYTLYKFNPGTFTCSLVEVEPPTTFKSLRKPEIGEYEKQHIKKIKEHGQGLDPETLQSMIQTYINKVLRNPVDDNPQPGPNAPENKPINPTSQAKKQPGEEKKALAKENKKQAKVRRLNVPPRDVVKYYGKEEPYISWELPLRGMYLMSRWDHVKRRRIFAMGVACLAAWCGMSEHHVKNILARMKVRRVETKKGSSVKGIIKLRGRGWPGEGCSRWELPCNMGLVMRWRRHLPKK